MRFFFPATLLALALLPPSTAATLTPAASGWSPPRIAALMTEARLTETSGIAAASRPGHWWVINDSGHAAELHLMDGRGKRSASFGIEGVGNTDWEDLAAFEWNGRRHLLIADTGDNGGIRETLELIVVAEPARLRDGDRLPVAWRLRFRWPDGARDCEAVAVDAARGEILLISKKRVPPELFRLPLRPPGNELLVAERVGLLAGIAQPNAEDLARNPVYGRFRSQISAADLSPDGRTLAVLNYRAAYLYIRSADGDWSVALQRPERLDFPWMPQAEAIAFARDGRSLWVAGEQTPSPLIRFDRRP